MLIEISFALIGFSLLWGSNSAMTGLLATGYIVLAVAKHLGWYSAFVVRAYVLCSLLGISLQLLPSFSTGMSLESSMMLLTIGRFAIAGIIVFAVCDLYSKRGGTELEFRPLNLRPFLVRLPLYLRGMLGLLALLALSSGFLWAGNHLLKRVGPTGGVALMLPMMLLGLGLYSKWIVLFLMLAVFVSCVVDAIFTQGSTGRDDSLGFKVGAITGMFVSSVVFFRAALLKSLLGLLH